MVQAHRRVDAVPEKEFGECIKRGAAEGEALATSKLFEAVKKGQGWAICFFLKSRCGWRDTPGPGGVNVNIHGGPQRFEERKAEEEHHAGAHRLLTVDERRQYLELMERAARRQREGMPAIEVQPLKVEEIEAEAAELEREGKSTTAPSPRAQHRRGCG